jgi:hypothetical protein
VVEQVREAEGVSQEHTSWLSSDSDLQIYFCDTHTTASERVDELNRSQSVPGMAQVFTPGLNDPEADVDMFIDLSGGLDGSGHEIHPLFFVQVAGATAICSGDYLPVANSTYISANDCFHKVCGKALQINQISGPCFQPAGHAVCGQIQQWSRHDIQPTGHRPVHQLVKYLPVVLAIPRFEAMPWGVNEY